MQQKTDNKQKGNLASSEVLEPSFEMARQHPLKTNKWSMGLNASGGLLAANNSTNEVASYYVMRANAMSYAPMTSFALVEYETRHSKHHLPVRMGMSLHYQLNDRLALLSGVNYSWLYSEFTVGSTETDQHLHYLGVPIGVAWRLWSNDRLQFYLTGSAMVEKCLNEKPWQWSVDAGAGAEYAITQQAGLYFEPSLGYFFDDGTSFEHYYKDHPLAPSIMFGLRMHLK